jgi:hypothetical protein
LQTLSLSVVSSTPRHEEDMKDDGPLGWMRIL